MSDVTRILVPMDGSPLSKQALKTALVEYPHASIIVLHVIDPTQPGYSYPIEFVPENEPLHGSEEWFERSRELADTLFQEVKDIATKYDTTVTTELTEGDPGRQIIDYTKNHDIDQIVIGSHGRDEDDQFYLGSVTEAVVFRAPTRVLLVR